MATASSQSLALRCLLVALVAAVALCARAPAPHAETDRVAVLSETLLHAKHHEERISAAVSLGRLEDRRAAKALIQALSDEHHSVRALAAVALGRLGDDSAVAPLRKATRDPDRVVRRRARNAIKAILARQPAKPEQGYKVSAGKGDPGFGQAPRALERPEMLVSVRSATDTSGGSAKNKRRRDDAAARMKAVLVEELESAPGITMDERVARKLGLMHFSLDVSITRCDRRVHKQDVEVGCEIRIAISDDRGRMLSHLTGSGRVQVPKRSFKESLVPRLEIEVVEGAVKGLKTNLLAQLRRSRGQ